MLKVENLSKKYNEYKVINNINFTFEDGDFTAILGESGSGKSTFLYLMSGLLKPTSGNVYFDNEKITDLHDRELSKIRVNNFGFVFQANNLLNDLTVVENIELPLILSNKNPKQYYNKIYDILQQIRMTEFARKNVNLLSGGQQQRVAIARALINDPKIIFADEPTGNLDSKNRDNIIDIFGQINKDKKVTIIMVTHSEKTLKNCNKIIHIVDGSIVNDS